MVDALRRRERGAGKALREICDANRGGLGKWVGGFAGVLQGMGGGGGVEVSRSFLCFLPLLFLVIWVLW